MMGNTTLPCETAPLTTAEQTASVSVMSLDATSQIVLSSIAHIMDFISWEVQSNVIYLIAGSSIMRMELNFSMEEDR